MFGNQMKSTVSQSILKFLVMCNVAPNIVDHPSFKDMLTTCALAKTITIPNRKAFGLHNGQIGAALEDQLKTAREYQEKYMVPVISYGGTLCSDGAKNRKRNALNSVLISKEGSFFVQSTDASGKYKSSEYLFDDIENAVKRIGADHVFIVCMDGACKKTLRLIDEKDTGVFRRIFGQRCATHGCNLLLNDIGKLFQDEITLCTRLLKFMCCHDAVYCLFDNMNTCPHLVGTCETRFASQVYSTERILDDKVELSRFFVSHELEDLFQRPNTVVLLSEKEYLRKEFIQKDEAWELITIFYRIVEPIRILLRISDSNEPSLRKIAKLFDTCEKTCIKLAEDAYTSHPIRFPLLVANVTDYCIKRKSDIVSDLAKAAAMINPEHLYCDPDDQFDIEGGTNAFNNVMDKFYKCDDEGETRARKVYSEYIHKQGLFFGNKDRVQAAINNGKFWEVAQTYYDSKDGDCELFRKLYYGYCGQGESERLNKEVKYIRSINRNRQSHAITQAYLELKSLYKHQDKMQFGAKKQKVSYLKAIRENFEDYLDKKQHINNSIATEIENDDAYDIEPAEENNADEIIVSYVHDDVMDDLMVDVTGFTQDLTMVDATNIT